MDPDTVIQTYKSLIEDLNTNKKDKTQLGKSLKCFNDMVIEIKRRNSFMIDEKFLNIDGTLVNKIEIKDDDDKTIYFNFYNKPKYMSMVRNNSGYSSTDMTYILYRNDGEKICTLYTLSPRKIREALCDDEKDIFITKYLNGNRYTSRNEYVKCNFKDFIAIRDRVETVLYELGQPSPSVDK